MSNKMEDKAMKSAATRALVPRLRFPEFREAGEWDAKELTDLIEVVTPPKKIPTTQYSTTGSYPIIDQSQAYISGWTDDEDAVISHELPLIVFGDHTCVLKITDVPFVQGADGIKIFHASSDVSTSYLYQHLLFNPVKMEEYKRHFSILKKKIVVFPEEKSGEQKKIADCLSSIDELVTLETQKLDTLKTHKKGLMQQLFPAEGKTMPKLRFPEFRDAGEWEEKTLSETCKRITNGKANAEDHEEGGIYPLFDRSDVIKRSNTFSFDGEAVIIPGEGMHFQPKYFKGKFNLHQRAYALMEHQGEARFVYHALDRFKDIIARKAVQSTVLSLRLPIIEQFVVATPEKLEQQKIADCLSSFDGLIAAQAQKLDTLKAHKKGLMQLLFPALDEVAE